MLRQSAFGEHPPLLVRHSLMSVQVSPLPVYPDLHVHVREPPVLRQFAFDEHPPLLTMHSLISMQSILLSENR